VRHPFKYKMSGFIEIQQPPKRYRMIDRAALLNPFSVGDDERFCREHKHWVEMELAADAMKRKALWSELIAVGSEGFVSRIKEKPEARAGRSAIISEDEGLCCRNTKLPIGARLGGEKNSLRLKNSYYFDISPEFTIG
jgi:putative transposase